MGDYRHAPSSRSSRSIAPRDITRLQAQQDSLHTRVLELKAVIDEKDAVIKGQISTIKLYEFKFGEMREQVVALRRAVAVLSEHITAKLRADLPLLPDIPQEEGLKREDFSTFSSPNKRRKRKKSPSKGINQSFSAGLQGEFPSPSRLFTNFSGSDFLKAILEAQFSRKDFQKRLFALSASKSREALLAPTQTALFETLSFFLSCRNAAVGCLKGPASVAVVAAPKNAKCGSAPPPAWWIALITENPSSGCPARLSRKSARPANRLLPAGPVKTCSLGLVW